MCAAAMVVPALRRDGSGKQQLGQRSGTVKRSHYREATKLAYTDFYCYNPDSLNCRVRFEVAGALHH
jgi:hypothetical protein